MIMTPGDLVRSKENIGWNVSVKSPEILGVNLGELAMFIECDDSNKSYSDYTHFLFYFPKIQRPGWILGRLLDFMIVQRFKD